MSAEKDEISTFESIFFRQCANLPIGVPDYQRAYSWGLKQLDLFIADLKKYEGKAGYYFGHFIVEKDEDEGRWELVDGQQRLTTFVLFLMVCRQLCDREEHAAYPLIGRFETVSYDSEALAGISGRLGALLLDLNASDGKKPPTDDRIWQSLGSPANFTRSQGRMARALLRFHQAFNRGELAPDRVAEYIDVVMNAHSSLHLTHDKSVAVNIFEMHNTRGVPLSTLEIVKAKLMQFVHDHGGKDRREKVKEIQREFGEIFAMEESLAEKSFRGEMTMGQLLRLHLRVVDDGTKRTSEEFKHPAINAGDDELVGYVEKGLRSERGSKNMKKPPGRGVDYAVNLARELRKSVMIVSQGLPAWDKANVLVGDVLILDRELSCQFFLIACRLFESAPGYADGRLDNAVLPKWEKLVFTRDFHGKYYNLKGTRDDFEKLFEECLADKKRVDEILGTYLSGGFRRGLTDGLQSLVREYVEVQREHLLKNAYGWWRPKMVYAVYKYETDRNSDIRRLMKGTVSVEHILPQAWQWEWIEDEDNPPQPKGEPVGGRDQALLEINSYVNGLGNLLLLSESENSAQGNSHPKDKRYEGYVGGSYDWHHGNLERWSSSTEWPKLIEERGVEIFDFMMSKLLPPVESEPPPPNGSTAQAQ